MAAVLTTTPLVILVLDDDEILLRAISGLLRAHGDEVLAAATTKEASDFIAREKIINVGLLDWWLRGETMTGLDVGKVLIKRGVPVFMMSGHSKEEIRGTWLDPLAGVLEFIEKPVEWHGPHGLKDRIDRVRHGLESTRP